MKVAYISHHTRPCYEYGWFSKLDFETVRFIDTDFSKYPTNAPSNVEYCKVSYKEIPLLNHFFHSTASPVYYLNFEKYLEDVDVVIVLEVFSTLSKQFVEYCKKTNKKVVVLVYELITNHPIYKLPIYGSNKKYSLKNADIFVCVSHAAKSHLIKLGADEEKVKIIYPGIDLDLFKPSQHDAKSGIIFVANLSENKGIDLFLQLYEKIKIKYPNVEFGVIGGGAYKDKVEQAVSKTFKYYGRIENKEIPKILGQYGIYILPAKDTYKYGFRTGAEQFGFSLVEAMACGLAVVSTDCGAIKEVITDNNIVCNQNNLAELTESTLFLLNNSVKRQSIGQKNREIVKINYDFNNQAEQLALLLKTSLS